MPEPDPLAAVIAPEAEIQYADGHVQVTLPFPEVAPEDLVHFVGSNLVLVWSRQDPELVRTMVQLPVDIVTGSAVARFHNGVFDLAALPADPEACRRTFAALPPPTPEHPVQEEP